MRSDRRMKKLFKEIVPESASSFSSSSVIKKPEITKKMLTPTWPPGPSGKCSVMIWICAINTQIMLNALKPFKEGISFRRCWKSSHCVGMPAGSYKRQVRIVKFKLNDTR